MSKTVHTWTVIGDVLVSLTTAGPVIDSQWNGWVKDMETRGVKKCLGATLGATELTSLQRKRASDVARAHKIRVCAITDDALVRGIVTAVSWLGVNIKAFSWSNMPAALQFLEVPPPVDQHIIVWYEQTRRRFEL